MEAATAEMTVVERFQLKAFAEAVMVVDEGVAATKDVELGMMMGAGILPGPFARADEAGLDSVLEQLERAQSEWGDAFEPPTVPANAFFLRWSTTRPPATLAGHPSPGITG